MTSPPPYEQRCKAFTRRGDLCANRRQHGDRYCASHLRDDVCVHPLMDLRNPVLHDLGGGMNVLDTRCDICDLPLLVSVTPEWVEEWKQVAG